MEFNKIFAAILVAGIVASLSGFIANEVFIVKPPEEDSYKVEVSEADAGGGAVAEAKPEPILALIAAADVSRGQAISKACAACHNFEKGGPNRVGPNLWGILNNKHAHMDNFAYSDAMKALHDKAWTYHELNGFLWNPKKHIAGTKMVFAGIKKPEDRAAVIAWLRTLSDAPAALPTQAEIDEDTAAFAPPAAAEAPEAEVKDAEGKVDDKAGDKSVEAKPVDAKAPKVDAKADVKPADAAAPAQSATGAAATKAPTKE